MMKAILFFMAMFVGVSAFGETVYLIGNQAVAGKIKKDWEGKIAYPQMNMLSLFGMNQSADSEISKLPVHDKLFKCEIEGSKFYRGNLYKVYSMDASKCVEMKTRVFIREVDDEFSY